MSVNDKPTVTPLQLFAEVLLIGVLVCVASLPIVTVVAAGGAGSTLLRELIEDDRTPSARRFAALLGTAVREPLAVLAPLALVAVGALDTLALLGGVPGGRALGPAIGLAMALGATSGLRAAARWRPGAAWRDVLADALPAAVRDWPGSLMLAAALVVVGIVAVQLPAFALILPGLLVMAAVAVERRVQ